MANKLTNLFTRFSKVYWVVLSFELLERGAYYSMMPILAVHFMYNVGLNPMLVASITAFMYPFQYGMPIFTSALAEKVGYKKQMIFGFGVLALSYVFLSIAFNTITAIFAVMAVGFGIGCYKPLVSSTIAKSTDQKDRNVAYSVYYWIVNFAAAMFALVWGLLMLFNIIPQTAFAWVFRVSAIYFVFNILIAIFIFREIPRSGQVKTFKDVGNNIATAFKDKKFVVMMLLIAGFWALYSTTLSPFILIMYGYGFLPATVPVILLGVINPGTIILLGGPLSKFAERIESIKLLMGGVFIYLIGLAMITFGMEYLFIVIPAMIIYSIGEFMVAPGYLAFVSKLAPKEKVSAYIGCNFLASFAGIFGGALVGGIVVTLIGIDMRKPHFFYGLLMAFGLCILVGFMIYNKYWGQDIINRAKEIEAMEMSEEDKQSLPVQKKKEPALFKIFEFKLTGVVALLIVPVILIATFAAYGTYDFKDPGEVDITEISFSIDKFQVVEGEQESLPGSTIPENTEETITHVISVQEGELLKSITFTLTWTDEDDIRRVIRTWENQPDTFSIEVYLPADPEDEDSQPIQATAGPAQNVHGSNGELVLTVPIEHESKDSLNGTGSWEITIICGECGDLENQGVAFTKYNDVEGSYELSVKTELYTEASE